MSWARSAGENPGLGTAMNFDAAARPIRRRSRSAPLAFLPLALVASATAWADTYSFTALPNDVAGPAGSTVGWGYTISNQSSTSWLVVTALSAGIFDHGTPNYVFDFPDIAPGASVTASFDAVGLAGLYEFTWDASAPAGFVNSGFFILSAQWWDGDPLAGGNFLTDALDESAAYSATVLGSPSVPEPTIPSPLPWVVALVLFLPKARDKTGFPR